MPRATEAPGPGAAEAPGADDGLPTVELVAPDDSADLLRSLQALVLKHPEAAQAAFGALVAEGRAFARTPQGQSLKAKLEQSSFLHRARLILDLPGISMLEADGSTPLPSTYLDTIFMLASSHSPDEVLDQLFQWRQPDDA